MRILPNGQWTLQKSESPNAAPSIEGLVGKTHTVQVHPDLDHLYNVKGFIQNSGKPHIHLNNLKSTGQFNHIIDRVPRDNHGKVTPQMIDQHIASLPKQNVEVKVVPYTGHLQQHRSVPSQYIASVGFSKDGLKGQPPEFTDRWNQIKDAQHSLGGHDDQIGWARLDPWRAVSRTGKPTANHEANPGHWHIDEIQSDLNSPQKLNSISLRALHKEARDRMATDPEHIRLRKEIYDPTKDSGDSWRALTTYEDAYRDRVAAEPKWKNPYPASDTLKVLSHGHEDPQHLVHSAVNQLARQHGITSTSMDLPKDQAHQSWLKPTKGNHPEQEDYAKAYDDKLLDRRLEKPLTQEQSDELWNKHGSKLIEQNKNDIDFKSAADKLGPQGMREWAHVPTQDPSSWIFRGGDQNEDWDGTLGDTERPYDIVPAATRQKLLNLSPRERDAVSKYLRQYNSHVRSKYSDLYGDEINSELAAENQGKPAPRFNQDAVEFNLPIHQVNTYDKRPRRLGMRAVPKKNVLGEDPHDFYSHVQYGPLYKKLRELQELLRKA